MKALKWFGTITSVIGSFIVASQFYFVGYCFFVAGSVAWLTVGIIEKDRPLLTLNGFFFAANIFGLCKIMLA